jgi:acetylornithine deacetylase
VKLGTIDGFPTSVVAYATDVPALSAWGTPYLFGPGSIHVAHRDDERIEIDELRAAVEAYERLAVAALERVTDGGTPVAPQIPYASGGEPAQADDSRRR